MSSSIPVKVTRSVWFRHCFAFVRFELDERSPSNHCQSTPSLTEELFRTGKFSDIKIKVAGKEFHVHRCILSLASEVFERMFSSDMLETRSNTLEISDLSDEICEEMLRFIYCNEIHHLETNAHDLLYAADKYAIESLKLLCIQALIETFTYDTAAEMLVRANIYNSKLLKDHLLLFIRTYSREVFATEQWKQLERTQWVSFADKLLIRDERILPTQIIQRVIEKASHDCCQLVSLYLLDLIFSSMYCGFWPMEVTLDCLVARRFRSDINLCFFNPEESSFSRNLLSFLLVNLSCCFARHPMLISKECWENFRQYQCNRSSPVNQQ